MMMFKGTESMTRRRKADLIIFIYDFIAG